MNASTSGIMLTFKNLATRCEKPDFPALASSLVVRESARTTAVAAPRATVSPIAAIAVIVVTVVVETVVINALSLVGYHVSIKSAICQ